MGRRLAAWLCLAVFALLCAGCQINSIDPPPPEDQPALDQTRQEEEEAPAVPRGQKTSIALAYNPADSLNPYLTETEYNFYLLPLIYEGLFGVDGEFELQNLLCESYARQDPLQWTFEIKQGILFHDGSELTARDVEYSINQSKESPCFSARSQNIVSCAATGRYSLRIRLASPDSQLPWLLTMPVTPRNGAAQPNPPGTGRYRLQTADGQASLLASESWRGGALGVTEIRLSVLYPDSDLSYVVGSGGVDAVCFERPFAASAAIRGDFDIGTFPTADLHYLGVNKNNGCLQNAFVRQAISAALDRESLAQKLFSGYANPALLPVSPARTQFTAQSGDADQLLARAGCQDTDGDGVLNGPDGANIQLRLLAPQSSDMKCQAARSMAQTLESHGLSVAVVELPEEEFRQALARDDFDLFYGETILNDQFDISQMVTAGGALCFGGPSQTVTAALAVWKEAEPQQALSAQRALYTAFSGDMPFVPLAFGRGCVATGKGLMNPVQGANRNPYYNVENWAAQP